MGDIKNDTTNGNEEFDTTQSSNSNLETNQMDSTQDTNLNQNMESNSFAFQEEGLQQNTQVAPPEPTKKKFNGKLIALFIVIAVILVGSITAYAKRSTMANSFALMTKNPTEYYSYIEHKGLDSSIDKLTGSYDKVLAQYNEQKTAEIAQDASIKLTVNPEFTSMLGLGTFESVAATMTSFAKEGNSKSTVGILYNDASIITMDTYMNAETNDMYMKIPELSSAYLIFALNEIMEETASAGSTYDYNVTLTQAKEFLDNKTLSTDTLNSILNRYTSIVIDQIDEVELDKDVVLTAAEISSSFSKLTAKLNQEDLYNMGVAILTEAQDDQELIDLCVALEICTKEEFSLGVADAIVELTNSKQTMLDAEESVLMNVYVDKAGNIMGREFVSNSDVPENSVGYFITRKGTKLGLNGWVSEDDVKLVDVTGNGTYSSDGYNGSANISYSQYNDLYSDYTTYSFDVAFENANVIEENGYINGKYTLTSDSMMGMQLELNCTADKKQQQMLLRVLYGNLEAGALDILVKEGTFQAFDLPTATDEVYDALSDSNSYLETVDFDSFVTKLEGTLGIDNLGSYIESLLSGFMY